MRYAVPGVLLAVDPGRKCAVATFVDGVLHRVRSIAGDDLAVVADVVREHAEMATSKGDGSKLDAVIEKQFMSRGAKANYRTTEVIAKRRHEFETVLKIYGVEAVSVYPATWMAQLKQVPRYSDAGKLLTTKARYSLLARRVYGKDRIRNADEAAAALIGRWYLTSSATLV